MLIRGTDSEADRLTALAGKLYAAWEQLGPPLGLFREAGR
jgi:hypothetical protein